METIDETIAKQQSFRHVWKLLNPAPQYHNRENACRVYWNARSLQEQRRIYWQLRENKRMGIAIDENPLFALQECHPIPTNWNGRPGIKEMMKRERMVGAKYKAGAKYGIYTLFEAQLFEMEDINPLNYDPETMCITG